MRWGHKRYKKTSRLTIDHRNYASNDIKDSLLEQASADDDFRGRWGMYSFGTVTVLIDGQPYSFHEQAFDLVWRSPQLSPGDHFVRIIHESGESINLDYLEILN